MDARPPFEGFAGPFVGAILERLMVKLLHTLPDSDTVFSQAR
jgi:hypothetical protein